MITNNRAILKDENLNNQLLSNGFVVLDFDEPELLENAFDIISNNNGADKFSTNNNKMIDVTFHCTYLDHDKYYKEVVWKVLSDLIKPFVEKNLNNYKVIMANLFNKAPGTGFIQPHQNLTIVDEEKYTSVSIWIPIQDTNTENGTLYFLPKSHGRYEKYRNSTIHWAPGVASINIEDYNMIPMNLKVGQILIFDDSIVHGSPNNNSSKNRYVFHYMAIPEETTPVFCKKTDDYVNIIEVDDEFWKSYTPGDEEPNSPVIKTVASKTRIYTKETLLNDMHL
jgi:ectoine hydroxylase-related dioxygenase (phytanoyl-CoA dioxygenase family)